MVKRPVLTSQPSSSPQKNDGLALRSDLDIGSSAIAEEEGMIPGWAALAGSSNRVTTTNGSYTGFSSPAGRAAYDGRDTLAANTSGAPSDDDDDETINERSSLLNPKARKGAWLGRVWSARKPGPWYMVVIMFCFALALGFLAAPKIELYTQAICHQINADIASSHSPLDIPTLLLKTPDECRHSPAVQRRLSELNLILALTMGILCILVTPYWGSLSDRIGRKWCITVNLLGFVLGDLVLIIVLGHPDKLSYWWLIFFSISEGVFGGMAGGQSIMAAYISDCTEAGSRAGTFSLLTGMMFGGIAVGPAIASLLIQASGNPMVPFYGALGIHAFEVLFTAILMPESLPKDAQLDARKVHHARKIETQEANEEAIQKAKANGQSFIRVLGIRISMAMRPVTSVFAPLKLLGPRRRSNGAWDWSLPALALGSALYSMVLAVITVKMQYAQLKFGWNAVQLGNLMSLIGLTRIVALLILIPLIVRIIRRPHKEPERDVPPAVPDTTAEPEVEASTSYINPSGFSKAEDEQWDQHKAAHRLIHDYKFDLALARTSIFLDMAAYTGLVFTFSETYFVIMTVAQGLGSGTNPALSSLSLMFADPKETGALMAAIGVLSVLFAQVIAPILFNTVFATTVDFFPEAIFAVGASVFFASLVCLAIVRVRRPKWNGYTATQTEEEEVNASTMAL